MGGSILNERKAQNPAQQVRKIRVVAYSGHKANEKPLHFVVDDHRLEVKDVLDRWYGVEHDYWKVLADDGRVYLLKWHRSLDVWLLVKVFERAGIH
jgi:hypothetical protein